MGKDFWEKEITSELKQHLIGSSISSYQNANGILEDAEILFERNRYARSAALAILAEEEYGKAFLLVSCSFQKRWDSEVWKVISDHSKKQALSEGMCQIIEIIKKEIENNHICPSSQEDELISKYGHLFINKEKIENITEPIKKDFLKKRKKDKLKQMFLYVSINKNGLVVSTPENICEVDARLCIEKARKIKCIVETHYKESNVQYRAEK